MRRARTSTLFPYTTLFRSDVAEVHVGLEVGVDRPDVAPVALRTGRLAGHLVGLEVVDLCPALRRQHRDRSEEHTSELQSHVNLVCRLLLEKKKTGAIVLET